MTENAPAWVKIERTFDAPRNLVWSMWTESEHFAAWYGPDGATIPTAEMDVQVGGKRLICMAMETPNGPMQMWFTGEYKEIDAPNRLVYTEAMADADGNVMTPESMGMPEGTPPFTEVVVELTETDGQTHMAMAHVGVPADSPGGGGWAMAIDKLAARVAEHAG